ncbi:hypothetical protein K458DRAFT_386344 [Lentithecium fluviatile CBS 122367]|uniref:Uncharacterized protein n=1 Tax=Lentithecium fluviatile CBS 122367 TaxID=1168545 RepID=A0A6G1JAG8_9PLEO|nr:hypothetical protein K458DRAFT_386344 [Lentithecium fluviatile CBS 122367]
MHPLNLFLIAFFLALTRATAVPKRICENDEVSPRFPCENPNFEALELSRGSGDRYYQCCERYGVYLARIEQVSIEELENSIRQW